MPESNTADELGELHRDPVSLLMRYYREHGTRPTFLKGRDDYVLAIGADYNQELLSRPDLYLSPGFVYPGPKNSAQRRLCTGLVSCNGGTHKAQRRLLMPPFQKGSLDAYRDGMAETTAIVLDGWRTNCVRDVSQDALELIYHVTGRVLYALDADEVRRLDEVLDPWLDLNGRMMIAADLMAADGAGSYAELLSRSVEVERLFRALLERRKQSALGTDFLSTLVRINRDNPAGMTDVQMIGHLVQFFSVSFHSTRDVLIWALFLLAQHPPAAADLLDELTAELHGEAPTSEQLNRLTYLDGVVKEAMRLFPPLVYYSRTNLHPVELGGLSLRPNTTIVFSHYVTHRLPHLYPDPQRFRPERWQSAPAAPYAFLPFGSGPRMCLGTAYALMAVKVTLAQIWQRFRLAVVPGARIDRRVMITLFPRAGVPMWVLPQDGRFTAGPVCGDVLDMVDLPLARPARTAA